MHIIISVAHYLIIIIEYVCCVIWEWAHVWMSADSFQESVYCFYCGDQGSISGHQAVCREFSCCAILLAPVIILELFA